MSTFQVPQFIEQKPRIFWFLTLRQFLYLVAAGGVSLIAFYIFNFFFWFLVTIMAGGVAIAFAFIKIEGRDFPHVLRDALRYVFTPQTYTWQRKNEVETMRLPDADDISAVRKRVNLQSKLKNLLLNVTTQKKPLPKRPLKNEEEKYQVVSFITGEKKLARRVDY